MSAKEPTMRLPTSALALCACALFLPAKEQQKQEPEIGSPVARFLAEEKKRIEKEIEGNWILLRFESPDVVVDAREARGFATFCGGFLSMTLMGHQVRPGFFGPRPVYYIYG